MYWQVFCISMTKLVNIEIGKWVKPTTFQYLFVLCLEKIKPFGTWYWFEFRVISLLTFWSYLLVVSDSIKMLLILFTLVGIVLCRDFQFLLRLQNNHLVNFTFVLEQFACLFTVMRRFIKSVCVFFSNFLKIYSTILHNPKNIETDFYNQ